MNNLIQISAKKKIEYKHNNKKFIFSVAQSLFSSFDIDRGTQRLLRTISNLDDINYKNILDIGCGYGPIGICLGVDSENVHMTDIDALSIEFTEINANLNNLKNYKIYPSIDYSNVEENNFSLITSNIPAKIGETAIKNILLNAANYLVEDGIVAIVVIDEISEYVKFILSDSDIEILKYKTWPGHHVFIYKFNKSLDINIEKNNVKNYFREKFEYKVGKKSLKIQSVFSLSEFDTPSFDTQALLSSAKLLIKANIKNIAFYNCNMGILPVYLSKIKNLTEVEIIDRNLLALKITEHNLKNNNFDKIINLHHQIDLSLDKKLDVFIGIIDPKESEEILSVYINQIADNLLPEAKGLLVSKAKVINEVEKLIRKNKNLQIVKTFKQKGRKVICLKHI